MALGGGKWVVQNKLLPGSYVNFKSQPKITLAFADRGYAAIALPLDWGAENEIVTITGEGIQERCFELLGHAFTDDELRPIRTIMLGAKVLRLYNLNAGGKTAKATIGGLTVTARYTGVSGNKIAVAIAKNIDKEESYSVTTQFDGVEVDRQIIKSVGDFKSFEDGGNKFIKLEGSISNESATVLTYLTGGENGTTKAGAHSDFLYKVQGEYFNDIGYAGTDEEIKRLYEAFAKRMVDEVGYYMQLTVYKSNENHIAISSVDFDCTNDANKAAGVYWYLGQSAGTQLGTNPAASIYNGEYEFTFLTDKLEAEKAIKDGRLVLHKVDGKIRLLEDVNTFTNYSKEMNEDWALNEVVRIAFQRAKDITTLFNKYYMQKVLNNADGRDMLWADCVYHAKEVLQNQLGVLEGYAPEDTKVEKGIQKGGVVVYDSITPVTTMNKLYMTIAID